MRSPDMHVRHFDMPPAMADAKVTDMPSVTLMPTRQAAPAPMMPICLLRQGALRTTNVQARALHGHVHRLV